MHRFSEEHPTAICQDPGGKLQKLEQQLADIRASRDRLERELADLWRSRDRLRIELTTKTEALSHIFQTRSWRWTTPLRKGTSLLRRLPSSPTSAITGILRICKKMLGHGRPIVPPPLFHRDHSKTDALMDHAHIAAIIVSHNQAASLQQSLESLFAQTRTCAEILIVDDDSTDETKHIALGYAGRGVEYLHGTWRNLCAAQNAGLRSTESPILVFLRAGDRLPPAYLSCGQAALKEHPDAAIAYADTLATPGPFDPVYFERENTLPDCSLVHRAALLEVGGWSHGTERDALWITWRRILANGWKAVTISSISGDGARNFGRPSWLAGCHGEKKIDTSLDATLCLSLSGRAWMWPLTQEFLEQQTYPHARIHLVIIDTSQDPAFRTNIPLWLLHADYGKYTYLPLSVGLKGLADLPRRTVAREVADACAHIYRSFPPLCTTPWVFFLEDDVLPPPDAYPRLLAHFSDRTASVSALCLQRNGPHPIAWEWDHLSFPRDLHHQQGVTAIGGNGFCCVAVRGEHVRNGQFHAGPGSLCHDHNFYHALVCERGLQALLDWSCVCRHYVSPQEWMSFSPTMLPSSR